MFGGELVFKLLNSVIQFFDFRSPETPHHYTDRVNTTQGRKTKWRSKQDEEINETESTPPYYIDRRFKPFLFDLDGSSRWTQKEILYRMNVHSQEETVKPGIQNGVER